MRHNDLKTALRLLVLIVSICFSITTKAQEAYAVYTNDFTLTFYYDSQKSSRSGTKYALNTGTNVPGWYNEHRQDIFTVIFDPSFTDARPTSTYLWFGIDNSILGEQSHLKEIVGIQYLNTSKVMTMRGMFSGCMLLKNLDVSHFDTSKVTDMYQMFKNCSDLTSLDVSHFDTSNVTDMSDMFYSCRGLTSLDVSHFDTSKVTDMSGMFDFCSSLTNLDVSHFDTSKVTDMGGMFQDCSSLSNLDVSHFDTSKVTRMILMFYNCCGLSSLDVSHFDTSKVTTMKNMFEHCRGLTNLDVSHFNTSNVTDMNSMFLGCSGLTSLDVTHFDTSNVTDMQYMFQGCWSLTSLDITHFDTKNVTTMYAMFSDCTGLTSLDVTHFNTSKVTSMSSMFKSCRGLSALDVSNFDTSNVTDMYSMFYYCSGLTSLDLTNFNTSNVTRMNASWDNGMFHNCTNLTTIYVGEGWNTDKVTDSDNMFLNCNKLVGGMGTTYDVNHVDKEYAHIDGGASNPGYLTDKNATPQEKEAYAVYTDDGTLTFYYDNQRSSRSGTTYDLNTGDSYPEWSILHYDKIKKAVFDSSFAEARPTSTEGWFSHLLDDNNPVFKEIVGLEYLNTQNVTNMKEMFHGCCNLTSIDVSHFDTSNVTDMSRMFQSCRSLTTIDVSNFYTNKVTNMRLMFSGCSRLTSLDVSHFNTGKVTDMSSMFSGCSSLNTLDLSHFETSEVTDMYCMLRDCKSLTSLDLSNFNTQSVESMEGMFYGCSGLTSLNVSHFNNKNAVIMTAMFSGCSSLISIEMSNFGTSKVRDMNFMFSNCSELTTIYVDDSWSTDKVTSSVNMFSNCTSLVGGAGTKYDASHVDKAYAHIDGGPSNPGYLTDKNAQAPVSDSDDLQDFINGLGDNKGTEEEPVNVPVDPNGLSVDKDVEVADDLQLAITGGDTENKVAVSFISGSINIGQNSGLSFKNVVFASKDVAAAMQQYAVGNGSGIKNGGTLKFANCTFLPGEYTVENSSNTYIGVNVTGCRLINKTGGRINITSPLTDDLTIAVPTEADVEPDVAIVTGVSNTDHILMSLPSGYAYKYDATAGGIVVYSTTGITAVGQQTTVKYSYDTTGRKVDNNRKGLHIQRMSDGTVRKVMINN